MKKVLFELDNEPMSGLTHFVGFLLAVAALVVLVVFASLYGTAWHVVGFSLFGATMILLYAASTLYHFFPITHAAKEVLRRIDHAMIYVLIAGSYTPICLVTLRGGWGWSLFGVIWGLAILGVVWKSVAKKPNKVLSTLLYIAMGWLAVIALVPLKSSLSVDGLWWLFLGGVFYTGGAIAFAFSHIKFHPRWFGMHEVWHLCVIAGSFSHFWLMLRFVL